jgi:hypothetical protein
VKPRILEFGAASLSGSSNRLTDNVYTLDARSAMSQSCGQKEPPLTHSLAKWRILTAFALVLLLVCSLSRVEGTKEPVSKWGSADDRQRLLPIQQSEEPNNGRHNHFVKLLPGIKHVIINIGSNVDPPLPPADNESIAVIAIEPVLGTAAKIAKHPRLYVICAAIADVTRFQTINLYK